MRTVFTNGCFDVLHAGHVALLWQARALGDRLIVGLNSDESIKRLKGPGRPVNPVALRELVLRALRPVDAVVIFNENTVTRLLLDLRPDIWVKGGDYTLATINPEEHVAATKVGTEIRIIPRAYDMSTTAILQRTPQGMGA